MPFSKGIPAAAREMLSSILCDVCLALDSIVPTELAWKRGLCNPGGPHRRLAGMFSPISIGDDECLALGWMIHEFRPAHTLVIGNGFGLSACYLASVMRISNGVGFVALDSQEEGNGRRCAEVADKLRSALGLSLLENVQGRSPEAIQRVVVGGLPEVVLLDGNHDHPQPSHDLEGLLPYLPDKAIVVWHDFWVPGVRAGVELAKKRGFKSLWLPTSCEIVLSSRDEHWFDELRRLFPAGVEDHRPNSNLKVRTRAALAKLRYTITGKFGDSDHPVR